MAKTLGRVYTLGNLIDEKTSIEYALLNVYKTDWLY